MTFYFKAPENDVSNSTLLIVPYLMYMLPLNQVRIAVRMSKSFKDYGQYSGNQQGKSAVSQLQICGMEAKTIGLQPARHDWLWEHGWRHGALIRRARNYRLTQ